MSKLLKQYEELKKNDASSIYLFRVGIFYNILNEDAKLINEKLGLKITDLGPNIFKCGFPVSQLDKYIILLNKMKIKYKVINNLPNDSNINDYLKNVEIKKILNKITDMDLNNTTFHQAFNTLLDIQNKLKNMK
jgi:DNA mismatch repair ATPase MutS|nr:MAG TPA: MutS domain I [Caudoviricetes sp.]